MKGTTATPLPGQIPVPSFQQNQRLLNKIPKH